jgi:hypothetical protein
LFNVRSHEAVSVQAADTDSPADTAGPTAPVGPEQAEAALVEHYPRLVRVAYLILPPSLGRGRRVQAAHAIVQRSLPRGRGRKAGAPLPAPRRKDGAGLGEDPGYALLRVRVVRQALGAGKPLLRLALPSAAQLPPLLPRVWGLRLFPRQGGADELALDGRLAKLSPAARAAFVLRGLDGLAEGEARRVLEAAGVADPGGALAQADAMGAALARRAVTGRGAGGGLDGAGGDASAVNGRDGGVTSLLMSPEFDACTLRARPTDLVRRRQHSRAALAALAAAVVCGALLLPGGGWGPDGPAAPPYAQNAAAQAALDPAKVVKVAPAAWHDSPRTDFSAWPARGSLVKDTGLLRRALAVWARPGPEVHVSTTSGTQSGPPMGPPQLLYAGTIDGARVVMFYDGLRIVRYAEPVQGSSAAALDFARADGAGEAESDAVVLTRTDGNVQYLTAPWVTSTSVRDLLAPGQGTRALHRDKDGVTDPLRSPALAGTCTSWDTLDVRDDSGERLLTDLGELLPARLTSGSPDAPKDVTSAADRASWARSACLLSSMTGHGVRTVNSWQYAQQELPDDNGLASWVCTRGDTWKGNAAKVVAEFLAPETSESSESSSGKRANPGAIAAASTGSAACSTKAPQVLAGVLWKSSVNQWYLLAAGSEQVASLSASGDATADLQGRLLSVSTKQGAQVKLKGRLQDGSAIEPLH